MREVSTDVDGIKAAGRGLLISVNEGSEYEKLKAKAIEDRRMKDRINSLESDVAQIKDVLQLILQKVSE